MNVPNQQIQGNKAKVNQLLNQINPGKKTLDRKQAEEKTLRLFKLFEIDPKTLNVDTLEELVKYPPLMINAKVMRSGTMDFGGGKMNLKKGTSIVMPLGLYSDIHRDTTARTKILKPAKKQFKEYFKRYQGQDLNNKSLLIFRTGGFGDLIFIQPIVKYLKEKYPTCHIVFCSSSRFLPILLNWPAGLIDEYLTMPFSKEFLISTDYHLSFEGSIERCKEAHVMNCYDIFSKVAGLEIDHTNDAYKPTLIPKEEDLKNFSDLGDKYVVAQMRASNPIRMMSEEKWIDILNKIFDLGYKVVVMDSPQYAWYYKILTNKLEESKRAMFVDLCSRSQNINASIAVISKADAVIGIDSSFLHFGNALGKPVLGLYGPFKGDLRLRYYSNAMWLENPENGCKQYPCFSHMRKADNCPYIQNKKTPLCLDSINNDQIIDKFKTLLKIGDTDGNKIS